MKTFKIEYKLYVKIFLSIALIISIAGLVFNIISIVEYFNLSTRKLLSHSILTVVTAFLCVIISSLLFFGRYKIKDGKLVTQFGVLRFKTDVFELLNATHFKKTNILVIYYKNAEYSVIMISPEFYKDFIESIRSENPNFYSSFESE
jgi:hypothetical protein